MVELSRVTPATADVLEVLLQAEEPTWGLRVVAATGRPAGSVYPILARLESGGWVASRWDESPGRGPRRPLYDLTAEGRLEAAPVVTRARRAAAQPARVRARPEAGPA